MTEQIALLEGEIAAIQGDIARRIDTLGAALPDREALVRGAAAAATVAVGAWVALAWVLRRRRKRRDDRRLRAAVRDVLAETG